MTATLLDILMILSLGLLAGTGTGLLIGFLAGKQKRDWAAMEEKDKLTNVLLILACSAYLPSMREYWQWYRFSGMLQRSEIAGDHEAALRTARSSPAFTRGQFA